MCLGALCAVQAAGAPRLELLGQPCRSRNVLAGRVVRDRSSGREMLVMTNMNEASRAELIFVDWEKDTARVFRAPRGAGSWALREVAGDRLAVGTFYDGQFMLFDLKRMRWAKSYGVPGESYIWNLAIGGDGRVYGGTYPGGKLASLDLATGAVTDCGAPAPPNLYLRTVSATPDGRILCYFMTEKPTTRIYDPSTRAWAPPPAALEGASQGAVWHGFFLVGDHAFAGRDLTPVTPVPFPVPPEGRGSWTVDPDLTTPDTLYLRQGSVVYRCKAGETALTRVAEVDLRGGRLLAASAGGAVLGVRGQDYFVLHPGDTRLDLRRIPGETAPRPTHFLEIDARGRVWGGPSFGQTLFSLDPTTRAVVNTSTVTDSGGEVYDVAFIGDTVYAASYAGGDIVRYEPDRPWNQLGGDNPRTIVSLGQRGYIRPTGGIVAGADGKLYSGWMAKYGVYGGAIAITNPSTGATDLIENPLAQQAITGLAVGDGLLYVGTGLGANGLPDLANQAPRFGIVDARSARVLHNEEMPGSGSVRNLTLLPATGTLAVGAGSQLRLFDTARRAFMQTPADVPPITSGSVAQTDGRTLWYGSKRALVSLDSLTRTVATTVQAPADIDRVAAGADGSVYVSCGTDVYVLRR